MPFGSWHLFLSRRSSLSFCDLGSNSLGKILYALNGIGGVLSSRAYLSSSCYVNLWKTRNLRQERSDSSRLLCNRRHRSIELSDESISHHLAKIRACKF